MSEPGGASEVGHIIAYLSWNLAEWDRQTDQIRRDVNSLSRLSPEVRIQTNTAEVAAQLALLRRQADEIGRSRTTVNVQSNADRQTFQMHALRDSILLLGPAAIPVGGVIAGALAGAIPTVAALALGIGGIRDEMKSGALEGTQYGTTLHQIGGEFHTLKAIAAGGLLDGINQAWRTSGPLVKEFNGDVGQMSHQLGQIIAGAGPGLLSLFTQLNPLFVTFGNELIKGADHLEHWASSTTGIHSFVGYVQRELPAVEHTVGQLIELFVHLSEGLGPLGHVALTSLGVIAQLLNAIPVDVLGKLETGALAVYFAFRTWQAINAIVAGVGTAVSALQAPFAAHAARAAATSASVAASAAEEAAAVERAALAEALAAQEAADAQMAAAIQLRAAFAANAVAAMASAQQQQAAAAEQVVAATEAAAAAEANAARTAAAAAAAAAAVQAGGERAALGWSAMLGPIGALVAGLGILGFAFLGSSSHTKEATQANQDYAASVKQSTDALNAANLAQTAKSLGEDGSLDLLDKLKASNTGLTLTYGDLITAVNGSSDQFTGVIAKLKAVADANTTTSTVNGKTQTSWNATGKSAINLITKLGTLHISLADQIKIQKAINEANKEAVILYDGGSAAAHRQAAALGATSSAYLAAQVAAKKNAEQTREQTVAWQLANDAANLLQQTLDKLNGKKLSYAQADNAFEQQLVSLQKNLKGGSKELHGLSEGAITNRGQLLQLVQSAEQTAGAYGKMTKSTEAGRAKLVELRKQIIDNAVAQGANRTEVTKYVDSLLKIPKSVPPTRVDVAKEAAEAKIKDLQGKIDDIRQGRIPHLDTDTLEAREQIQELQDKINALQGKSINIDVNTYNQTHRVKANAAGTGNLPDGWSSAGEAGTELIHKQGSKVEIYSNSQSRKIAAATGMQVQGFANGTAPGVVTLDPTKKSGSGGTASGTTSSSGGSSSSSSQSASQLQQRLLTDAQAGITKIGQITSAQINLATSGAARIMAQINAAGRNLSQDINDGLDPKKAARLKRELDALAASARHQFAELRVHIKTSDLDALKHSLNGTVAEAKAAFATLLGDARKLGISSSLSATLAAQNRTLDQKMSERARAIAQLGAPVRDTRTAYEKLNDILQAQKQIASTVKGATTGSFNIATSGTGYDGQQKITAGNIAAENAQRAAIAKKYVDGVIELDKEGLNQADVDRLAGEGPSAWPEVQALLAGGKSKLKSINASERSLAASGAKLGNYIGQQDDGKAVAAAQKNVNDLKNHIRDLNTSIKSIDKNMAHEVRKALEGMHFEEKIDAAGIARIVARGNKQLARRGGTG